VFKLALKVREKENGLLLGQREALQNLDFNRMGEVDKDRTPSRVVGPWQGRNRNTRKKVRETPRRSRRCRGREGKKRKNDKVVVYQRSLCSERGEKATDAYLDDLHEQAGPKKRS